MKDIEIVVSENVQKLIDEYNLTHQQLAKIADVSVSTVGKWILKKASPRMGAIQKISDHFQIPKSYILDEDDYNLPIPTFEYKFYPTQISAGIPNNVEAIYEQDYISLPDEIMGKYKGNKDIFVTKINGDSMNNIMKNGSLIIVKPTPFNQLKNGDIVVYSNEHEYSVKHYHKYGDTLVFKPNSTNKNHKEQEYSNENKIMIHGKVVIYIVEQD